MIFSGGLAFWRTETISYVRSSAQPRMVAVRGEGNATGRWHREHRNVATDYRTLFGGEPGQVDAVAVMFSNPTTRENG